MLRKALWHEGIRYRKTLNLYQENLILLSQNIKSPFFVTENSGMERTGKIERKPSKKIKNIGYRRLKKI
jgi:hypothetical protein